MAHRVVMPKLGLTMEKGVVVHWLKRQGERVEKGEKLLEVETDKIVSEIESPASGILLKVLVEEGAEVDVQTLLAVIGDQDEDVASLLVGPADSSRQEEPAASRAQPQAAASASTPGEEPGVRITPRARKLMAQHGLHAQVFAGYGKNRITEDDVKEFLQRQAATETPQASGQDATGIERTPPCCSKTKSPS